MRIIATSPVPPIAHQAFAELGTIEIPQWGDSSLWHDAEILIVRGERLAEEVIDKCHRLRIVARTGAGFDKIDIAAASSHGIPVIYAPVSGTVPVAEGTFALIMATSKRLGELKRFFAPNSWPDRYQLETIDLQGSTLGIIGLGKIGREVAHMATAFGMKVIAYEPYPDPVGMLEYVDLVSLETLAAHSDIITLHCSLTDATRGIIDRQFIARTRPGVLIINVSRGELFVDENMLIEALESGHLGGIGLDVFADEPPSLESALLTHPKVICTPHTIGLTHRWNDLVFNSLARDVMRVLGGDSPQFVVNPEVLQSQGEIVGSAHDQ